MNLPRPGNLRTSIVLAAAIALLSMSAGSAVAATPGGGSYAQNGKSAGAYMTGCTSNGDGTSTCADVFVDAFVGKINDGLSGVQHLNQLCVSLATFMVNDETGEMIGGYVGESGCQVDLPNGTLTFGGGLSSATLAEITITVEQYSCDGKYDCTPGPSRDITASGSWVGLGAVQTSKFRASGNDGFCREAEFSKGTFRQATFSGQIDSNALDGAYANLGEGKSTYRSRCSGI